MVGHKLGEFAPTRTYHGHDADDKKSGKQRERRKLTWKQEHKLK